MSQQSYRLEWVSANAVRSEWPQQTLDGTFKEALDAMDAKSMQPDFLLGQVLAADGRVLATVAKGGAKKLEIESAQATA